MPAPRMIVAAAALFAASAVPSSAQPLTFARADRASVDGARAIAVGDFDRNGWPDVAHANGSRGTVTILLNAAGLLTRARDVTVGTGPFAMTAADFNRDSIVDLAVANADSDSISVLVGAGDGTFAVTTFGVGAGRNPRGIAAADMNADGRTDLIYTGYLSNSVHVLYGTATSFTAGPSYTGAEFRPQGIATGDFDHDGFRDIAVAHDSSGGLVVFYGTSSRTSFREFRVVGGPVSINEVTAADVDGDGWDDIAAASTYTDRVVLYRGGVPGFRFLRSVAANGSPRDIAAADVNLDGRLDLATANRDSSTLAVFLGNGLSTWVENASYTAAGQGSRAVAVIDADIDGLPDVLTANQNAATVTVFTNTTSFAPAAFAFGSLTVTGNVAGQIAVGDFDRDGRPDYAGQAAGGNAISLIYSSGNRSTIPAPALREFWIEDLNLDGAPDMVVHRGIAPDDFISYIGDAFTGGFSERGAYRSASPAHGAEIADVNGDRYPDLVFVQFGGRSGNRLVAVLGGRDGFLTTVDTLIPPETVLAGAGDIDRDGLTDLIVRHTDVDAVEVLISRGDGHVTVGQRIEIPDLIGFWSATVADLNHDGWPDVVVSAEVAAFTLLGGPAGLSPAGYAIDERSFEELLTAVTLADVNVDGHLDLVSASRWIALGNGDGTFREAERFANVGGGVQVADVTRDGLPDVVYTSDIGGVAVLVNTRSTVNHAPSVVGHDVHIGYANQFNEEPFATGAVATDPDMHGVTYQWRDESGKVLSTSQLVDVFSPPRPPGTYHLTVTVDDGRGATATDSVTVVIDPLKEIVFSAGDSSHPGWEYIEDPATATGVRLHDPNLNAAKVQAPLASPSRFIAVSFPADPTQTYKLWIRMKADGNDYSNDSIWVQFAGAVDTAGRTYAPGTTSGLAVNLEECAGCGLSGWGWEDDGWGAVNRNGVLLRFPQGGLQRMVIQSREDGVSIDEIVLSSEKYVSQRPGTAKNDTTVLPITYFPE